MGDGVVAAEVDDVLVLEDSLPLKGFVRTSADVTPIRYALFTSAEDSSRTMRDERVIVGGLSKTLKQATREAFRFPAKRRTHDRGIVAMFAADSIKPKTLLGAYHGNRLRYTWR